MDMYDCKFHCTIVSPGTCLSFGSSLINGLCLQLTLMVFSVNVFIALDHVKDLFILSRSMFVRGASTDPV